MILFWIFVFILNAFFAVRAAKRSEGVNSMFSGFVCGCVFTIIIDEALT